MKLAYRCRITSIRQHLLKGSMRPKLVFMAYFCSFYGERALYKVYDILVKFHEDICNVTNFWVQRKWLHTRKWSKNFPPGFLCKFYDGFDHFSRTYEVPKFWIIKLYLDVSNVIYAIEYTKYAYKLLELLMPFNFMMKKSNFKVWASHCKSDKKCFLFNLKSCFCSRDIQIFVLTFWSYRKNGLIRKIMLISNL